MANTVVVGNKSIERLNPKTDLSVGSRKTGGKYWRGAQAQLPSHLIPLLNSGDAALVRNFRQDLTLEGAGPSSAYGRASVKYDFTDDKLAVTGKVFSSLNTQVRMGLTVAALPTGFGNTIYFDTPHALITSIASPTARLNPSNSVAGTETLSILANTTYDFRIEFVQASQLMLLYIDGQSVGSQPFVGSLSSYKFFSMRMVSTSTVKMLSEMSVAAGM